MNIQHWVLVVLCLFALIGCKTPAENSPLGQNRFPEVFHEAGTEADSSYIALRTIRLADGNLQTQVTGWGIEESGLFLETQTENNGLTMSIRRICGTVFTYTWVRRTFEYIITRSSEDTLQRICFTNFRDTLTVVKH